VNYLPWTFLFELQIAAPINWRQFLFIMIQIRFGHDDQGSESISFSFFRCPDIRKHVS
jgi:hypothetical protein